MTIHHPTSAFIDAAPVGELARHLPNRAERAFDLHPAIFAVLAGCFALFLAILGLTFIDAELAIPFVIFGVSVAMFLGVPAMWARIAPARGGRPQSWAEFLEEGVETGSGKLTGREALAQILTVPAMLVGWALAIAVIRAAA